MQHPTKFLFRVVAIILLYFVQQNNVMACDVCGCFIGVLPYDNQSSIGLMHRYRIFSGYPSLPGGSMFPSGAYRYANHSVLHGVTGVTLSPDDFESYKVIELRGKLFIHPRIELNFLLPFSENRLKSNSVTEKIDGLGDATILAGFHLINAKNDGEFRHRLVIGAGIKLPTGNYNSKSSNEIRNDIMIQNGTGSTDGIIYVAYTGGGHNFRWGTTLSGKINSTNKFDEQFSPSVSNTSFAGYLFSKGNLNVMPQVSVYQEATKGLWVKNELVEATAMRAVLLGPGIDVYYKNLSFSYGIQLPVYEKEFQSNLLNKGKMMVNLTWSFNQQKFLFHKKNV
ncbi:hypothetical protein BH09BAC5_BH09BAC5_00660 [soil metagenome]